MITISIIMNGQIITMSIVRIGHTINDINANYNDLSYTK